MTLREENSAKYRVENFVRENEFKYVGFNPTPEVKSVAKRILTKILEDSPSDSAATAIIKQSGEGFEAMVSLHSRAGQFLARAIEKNPADALSQLKDKLQEQIQFWRTHRLRLFSK